MIHLRKFSENKCILLQLNKLKIILNSKTTSWYHSNSRGNNFLLEMSIKSFFKSKRHLSVDTEYEDQTVIKDNCDSSEILEVNGLKYKPNYFQNLLYPDSDDIIINKIKNCRSIQEVFNIINMYNSLTPEQASQAVLILKDFQESSELCNECNSKKDEVIYDFTSAKSFKTLLHLIENNIPYMNFKELTTNLFYLSSFNVNRDLLFKIIDECEQKINKISWEEIDLSSLSRFCISLSSFYNIWAYYTLMNVLCILHKKLDKCCNYIDFGLITTCFQKSAPLLHSNIITKYKENCQFLIPKNTNEDEQERVRTIVKTVLFLNFRIWSDEHNTLVKQLLLSIQGSLNCLTLVEIAELRQVAFNLKEPIELINESSNIIFPLISCYKKLNDYNFLVYLQIIFPRMNILSIDELLLHSNKFLTKPNGRNEFSWLLDFVYNSLFYHEKRENQVLHEIFWNRILKIVNLSDTKKSSYLIWASLRYVSFIQNIKNRQHYFEASMLKSIIYFSENEIQSVSSSVKLMLLILYYDSLPLKNFSNSMCEKLLQLIHSLSEHDNLIASYILAETYRTKETNQKFLRYYVQLISALNNNSLEKLKSNNKLSISTLNTIFRAYCHRKGIKNTELFRILCNRYKLISEKDLSSKSISSIVRNCNVINHLLPEIVNHMIEYVINEHNNLEIGTLFFILNHIFNFGFIPQRVPEFIDSVIVIMNKQRKNVSRLTLLKAVIAIGYYSEIPDNLISNIFNVNFIRDTEVELQNLYCNKYRRQIRKAFMEINRIVCIDYPCRNIPWFHDWYCNKGTIKLSYRSHLFYVDVLQILKDLVKIDKSIEVACHSPYGHKIDILLYLNQHRIPVDPTDVDPKNLRKIAILLKNTKSDLYYYGKGMDELHKRQLELLNYEVVNVNSYLWNSMYMSEPHAKKFYIETQIWGSK